MVRSVTDRIRRRSMVVGRRSFGRSSLVGSWSSVAFVFDDERSPTNDERPSTNDLRPATDDDAFSSSASSNGRSNRSFIGEIDELVETVAQALDIEGASGPVIGLDHHRVQAWIGGGRF